MKNINRLVVFFYTQSLLNPSFQFNRKLALHLLPGILYSIFNIVIFVYDKLIIKDYYFYKDGIDKDFDSWYQISGQISMVLYFILTLRYYNRYKKIIVQITSNADAVLFKWIKNFLVAFLLMLLLPYSFDLLNYFYPNSNEYKGGWWFYLVFSLVLYYIVVTGYSNAVHSKIGFKMSVFDSKPILLLQSVSTMIPEIDNVIDIDYENIKESKSEEIETWKQQIEKLIIQEKLYQNPELSLTEVAKKLQTNTSIVSKAINQGFQMNFNDFINNYRVEAVKAMFATGEHKKTTLLGIAYDCGFNSKATFNRAFKKNTNYSPKEYLNAMETH